MVVGGKLTAEQCNMSHIDQSWKDYVRREGAIANKWENNWGFLTGEYRTLRTDIAQIREKRRPIDSEPPPLKLPPLKPPKQDTRNPFPMITSREIGWRSEHKLEVYGRWGRPKYSIEKQLKWPFDSIP